MGILVTRGRMMTDDFELNERSKKWIAAIHAQHSQVSKLAGTNPRHDSILRHCAKATQLGEFVAGVLSHCQNSGKQHQIDLGEIEGQMF